MYHYITVDNVGTVLCITLLGSFDNEGTIPR